MRSGDGPRCRGGCRTPGPRASGAPPPRYWPGEARPRSRSGPHDVESCFWRVDRVRPGASMASRYVTVLEAGTRGPAAVFSPRKHPMVLLGCLFGARRRSCLARSISNAYQVATKRRGVVRATWRAHRSEFSPVLTKIQDSARTATLPWLPSLSVRLTRVVRSVWRPTTR